MKLRIVLLAGVCFMGVPCAVVTAGQGIAPSAGDQDTKPVVIAADTYVRPVKYAKHSFGGTTYDTSGLPAATIVASDLRPRAVRFVGRHDRTYITFGDRRCHPVILFFDHRSRAWSQPRRVGKTGAIDDAHGVPTLAINEKGYLHVVYGSHGGKQYMRRSAAPEEVAGWNPPTVVAPRATYADLYFVGGVLHLFHREKSAGWGFRDSGDGGKTWSAFRPVCTPFSKPFTGVFYPSVWPGNEKPLPRLHMFWIYYGTPGWKDMNYAVSHDLGKTWQTTAGRRIGEQIQYGQGDPVYKGDTHGWPQQIVIDPTGRPSLIFGTGGPGVVDDNTIMFAYLDDTQWKTSKICDVSSRYCQCAVVVKGANHYRAYVPNGKWNGGEIFEFETTDGGRTWKHRRNVTRNSAVPNTSPVVVENGLPELQIIWCSGNRGVKGNVYAWGEAGGLPKQPNPVIRDALEPTN